MDRSSRNGDEYGCNGAYRFDWLYRMDWARGHGDEHGRNGVYRFDWRHGANGFDGAYWRYR
jgi:hypothetical protein